MKRTLTAAPSSAGTLVLPSQRDRRFDARFGFFAPGRFRPPTFGDRDPSHLAARFRRRRAGAQRLLAAVGDRLLVGVEFDADDAPRRAGAEDWDRGRFGSFAFVAGFGVRFRLARRGGGGGFVTRSFPFVVFRFGSLRFGLGEWRFDAVFDRRWLVGDELVAPGATAADRFAERRFDRGHSPGSGQERDPAELHGAGRFEAEVFLPGADRGRGRGGELFVDGARFVAERRQVLLQLFDVSAVFDPFGELAVGRYLAVDQQHRLAVQRVEPLAAARSGRRRRAAPSPSR